MWIELHDGVREHPKLLKLAKRLGISKAQAIGHVISLWCWTLRMAADGDLRSFDAEDLEIAAEWEGEQGAFTTAALGVKLLDKGRYGFVIHDWGDYSGSLKAAHRQREWRKNKEKQEKETLPNDDSSICDVTVTSQDSTETSRHADRPTDRPKDQTRPTDQTDRPTPLSSKLDLVVPEPEKPDRQSPEVLAVFAHYRTHHPRAHPRPSSKGPEWRCVKARLAEGYSVDDLKRAIDGIHLSPFHRGENERGQKYLGLKLALRDGDQVNKFTAIVEQHANGPPAVLSELTQRNLRAAENWVARTTGGG